MTEEENELKIFRHHTDAMIMAQTTAMKIIVNYIDTIVERIDPKSEKISDFIAENLMKAESILEKTDPSYSAAVKKEFEWLANQLK